MPPPLPLGLAKLNLDQLAPAVFPHPPIFSSPTVKMDALRRLAPIRPHPGPATAVNWLLSVDFADRDTWESVCIDIGRRLDRRYVADGSGDDTVEILCAFLAKLPREGQLVLMSEITEFKYNSAKLRQLRNFLVDALLRPSRQPSAYTAGNFPSGLGQYADAYLQ